jgi:hypothetical protein
MSAIPRKQAVKVLAEDVSLPVKLHRRGVGSRWAVCKCKVSAVTYNKAELKLKIQSDCSRCNQSIAFFLATAMPSGFERAADRGGLILASGLP